MKVKYRLVPRSETADPQPASDENCEADEIGLADKWCGELSANLVEIVEMQEGDQDFFLCDKHLQILQRLDMEIEHAPDKTFMEHLASTRGFD